MIAWFSRISNDLAKRTALGLPAPAPDTPYYHNNKTSGVSTNGTPLPTVKTLAVAIRAKAYSQSSLSQAATIATGLKSKGAVPRILGQFLTPGGRRDVLHLARRTIRRHHRRRRHRGPVLEGLTGNAMPHCRRRGGSKAALQAAEVDEKHDGIRVVDPNDVSTIPDAFETLLKQFKFLGMYALDS